MSAKTLEKPCQSSMMLSPVRATCSVAASRDPLPFHTGTLRLSRRRFTQLVSFCISHCHSEVYSPLNHCARARRGQRQASRSMAMRLVIFIVCRECVRLMLDVCTLIDMGQSPSAPVSLAQSRAGSMPMMRCQPVKSVAKVLFFCLSCKSVFPCQLIANGLPVCSSCPYSHLSHSSRTPYAASQPPRRSGPACLCAGVRALSVVVHVLPSAPSRCRR